MAGNIAIITSYDQFFGQHLLPWDGMDVNKMAELLITLGYKVNIVEFSDIVNRNKIITDSIILYSSSQKSEYKNYIEDVLLFLKEFNNILVPDFHLFRAHDNKGYQELYKRLVNLDSIQSYYFGHVNEILKYDFSYPIVLKRLDGAASKGVFLIHSKRQLRKKVLSFYSRNLYEFLKFPAKKILRGLSKKEIWYKGYNEKRFVIQEFIPNLKNDYKVLAFGEKFYVLKRMVRKGGFKASGSGLFQFDEIDNKDLLDYSNEVYLKLNTPVASLDICYGNGKYSLIEFQCMHFGPLTLMGSIGYYQKFDKEWKFVKTKSYLEDEFVNAVHKFIVENNLSK